MVRCSILVLAVLRVLSPPVMSQSPYLFCASVGSELLFEVKDDGAYFYINIVNISQGGMLDYEYTWPTPISKDSDGDGNCNWLAEVHDADEQLPDERLHAFVRKNDILEIEFVRVEESKTTGEWEPVEWFYYTYYTCAENRLIGPGEGFYCPYRDPHSPFSRVDGDTFFTFKDGEMHANQSGYGGGGIGGVEDAFVDKKRWVLPYNADIVCDAVAPTTCDPYSTFRQSMFLAPQRWPVFTFAEDGDVVLTDQADWIYGWGFDPATGQVLKFPAGRGLIVEGDLIAEGVTFTEATTGQGWGGIVLEGATADLDGVTVEHAETGISAVAAEVCAGACYALESTLTLTNSVVRESVGDGVVVYNSFNDPVPGSVVIAGSELAQNGGHGLYAALTPSTITVVPNPSDSEDESRIRDNGQSGVLADGSEITLDNTLVQDNGGSGVEAISSGLVHVFESIIQNNARYGAEATNYGEVVFTRPGTAVTAENSAVQLNAGGGLFAERYGSINAGTAATIGSFGGSCVSACNNTIQDHAVVGAPFDVSASSFSTVLSQLDWWGFDVDDSNPEQDLVLLADAGSLIEVVPTLDAPPGSGSRLGAPWALGTPAGEPSAERSGDASHLPVLSRRDSSDADK